MLKQIATFYLSLTAILLFTSLTACGSNTANADENTHSSIIAHSSESYAFSSTASQNNSSIDVEHKSNSNDPSIYSSTNPSSSDTRETSAATPESSNPAPLKSCSNENPASSATIRPDSSEKSIDPNLLWSDEFDGDTIDETKWGYNIGTGENGWGNSELEYYTNRPENVYVKDGMLHIRAQKEDYEGQKYTSTRLLSQNKFTFTYGTVEARIALPVGKGIWPAFWMLGENIDKVSWPTCGEIDIIEAVNDENVIYGTHHWAHEGSHAQYGNNTSDYYGTSLKLDISEFHTYKMTWDKEFITMYVDDFKYQEIDIKDTTSDMATFHKPFFFILNVAVGGSWPGFDIDDSQFPTEMQVDYIRVYK